LPPNHRSSPVRSSPPQEIGSRDRVATLIVGEPRFGVAGLEPGACAFGQRRAVGLYAAAAFVCHPPPRGSDPRSKLFSGPKRYTTANPYGKFPRGNVSWGRTPLLGGRDRARRSASPPPATRSSSASSGPGLSGVRCGGSALFWRRPVSFIFALAPLCYSRLWNDFAGDVTRTPASRGAAAHADGVDRAARPVRATREAARRKCRRRMRLAVKNEAGPAID
jgi:hypothetical protein